MQNPKTEKTLPKVPRYLVIIFGLFFVGAILNVANGVLVFNDLKPFEFLGEVTAQITGRPSPSNSKIVQQLAGFGEDENGDRSVLDSYDQCEIIDPNLEPEVNKVYELANAFGITVAGDNLGGLNQAPVLDGGFDEGLFDAIYKKGISLGMSYVLGMVTDSTPESISATVNYIERSNENGFVPIVRLCYVGKCGFDTPEKIISFYRSVHAQVTTEFIAMVGPNEPGTGEPKEMDGFFGNSNIDGVGNKYAETIKQVNYIAGELAPLRVKNGGKMMLAPGALNMTNATSNDVYHYFYSGEHDLISPEHFDYILGNTYARGLINTDEQDPYERDYVLGPDRSPQGDSTKYSVKDWVDEHGLRFILTEYGIHTEQEPGGTRDQLLDEAAQAFEKFCADEAVDGVLFFRASPELNDKMGFRTPDGQTQYPFHELSDEEFRFIIGNCSKKSRLVDNAWQNCNFDSCLYQDNYTLKSTATACGIKNPGTPDPEEGAALKIVCSDPFNCNAKKYDTIEVALPIKQFGSNSPAGTPLYDFMPICAEIAQRFDDYDALNQFAGTLVNSSNKNNTYPMPWLGSAINCSAVLVKALSENAASLDTRFSPSEGSTWEATIEENEFENENASLQNRFSFLGDNAFGEESPFIINERAICIDGYCFDKAFAEDLPIYQLYEPQNIAKEYEHPAMCASNDTTRANIPDLAIRTEPNNYIIGPELVVSGEETVWEGTQGEICIEYARRKLDGFNNPLFGFEEGEDNLLGCKINRDLLPNICYGLTDADFTCANPATGEYTPFYEGYQTGQCFIPKSLAGCLEIDYEITRPDLDFYYRTDDYADNIPTYDIPGVYDSLYQSYERLQNVMSERNLKVVFRENIGWEMKVNSKVRDANNPFDNSNNPYFYKQDLNSCEVPNNIFNNQHYLAAGNAIQTKSVYFDWLGYLDIMQEIIQVYSNNDFAESEQLIENPYPDFIDKEFYLETGSSSLISRFPMYTCDDIERLKYDPSIPEEQRWPVDLEMTCLTTIEDDTYTDYLADFLCSRGYEITGVCSRQDICIPADPDTVDNEGNPINLIYPSDVTTIASPYGSERILIINGEEEYDVHRGVDFGMPEGSNVYAADAGKVIEAKFNIYLGNYVKIDHQNGYITLYGHNSELLVQAGDFVEQGQLIALSGNSGRSTGAHLHFELRLGAEGNQCISDISTPGDDGCSLDPIPLITGAVISEESGLTEGANPILCVDLDSSDFATGKLQCEIDLTDISDSINWSANTRQIEARVEAYNLDNNSSYTWLANPENEDPALKAKLVAFLGSEEAYEQDRKQRIDVTEFVRDKAISLNVNPRFVFTLWVEETAGSAVGSMAMGCLGFRNHSEQMIPMPFDGNKENMIAHLEQQIRCVASYVDEFPDFEQFMCTYSGEEGWPNCDTSNFINNPNFPTNICKYYAYKPI